MKRGSCEYEIRLGVTSGGRVPFKDWILGIRDPTTRQRIYARIDRLRLGSFGDCRGLGEGVLELRIHHGPGLRVYFSVTGRRQVTLLCGGDKSTQARDIRRAKRYREEVAKDAD